MRSKITTALAVLGAVTVLVLAANTVALATTGKALIAGKTNTSSTITTLSRTTTGAGLQVKTKATTSAPLVVNGTGKVTHLNADKVDGIDSSRLRTTAYVFETDVAAPGQAAVSVDLPVPAGNYLVSYSAYMVGAAGVTNDCYVAQVPEFGLTQYSGETLLVSATGITPGLTGTGFVTKDATNTITVTCAASGNTPWTTNANEPLRITATRIDAVAKAQSLTPNAKIRARAAR